MFVQLLLISNRIDLPRITIILSNLPGNTLVILIFISYRDILYSQFSRAHGWSAMILEMETCYSKAATAICTYLLPPCEAEVGFEGKLCRMSCQSE